MIKNKMRPIHPGEILKEVYFTDSEQGSKQYLIKSFLEKSNIHKEIFDNLLNGEIDIDQDLANHLSNFFNCSSQFFINLQNSHDKRIKDI